MKEVYVVLSRTNTGVGKLIRFFTHYELNHSALALDKDLHELYTFGRINNRPALYGGFITETPGRYCPDTQDARIKVFRLSVTENKYEKIKSRIDEVQKYREDYLYNTYGAVLSGFGIWLRLEKCYTCIEFVTQVLGFKKLISINAFDKLFEKCAVYDGSFREYYKNEIDRQDYFFRKRRLSERAKEVIAHFNRLNRRFFNKITKR